MHLKRLLMLRSCASQAHCKHAARYNFVQLLSTSRTQSTMTYTDKATTEMNMHAYLDVATRCILSTHQSIPFPPSLHEAVPSHLRPLAVTFSHNTQHTQSLLTCTVWGSLVSSCPWSGRTAPARCGSGSGSGCQPLQHRVHVHIGSKHEKDFFKCYLLGQKNNLQIFRVIHLIKLATGKQHSSTQNSSVI